MKIGILGTGVVGQTIASKLCALGHDVKMGARQSNNENAVTWTRQAGDRASQGSFADAAGFGEVVFNFTSGAGSLEALRAAGPERLGGKLLLDLSNPLDFSKGMPPSLLVCNTDSLGEQIQRAFPATKVVKTLNTVTASLMVDPGRVGQGEHDIFVSGDDAGAKARVTEILRGWFGWKNVIDLGDMSTARGTEAYLLFWIRLWGAVGSPEFNVRLVR